MVLQLQQLLNKCFFTQEILAYVKDEGFNFQTCASGLNSLVSCASLVVMEPFNGSCFGHALSKGLPLCLYGQEGCHRLSYTSIQKPKLTSRNALRSQKSLGKRKQTWDKTCIDYNLRPRKFCTLVNTRFNILFLILLWSISWVANYAKGSGYLINVVLI